MEEMERPTFERFAGACAILAGASGFLYAVAFVIISPRNPDTGRLLSALFLTLGGLLSLPVMVALYHRLRQTDPGFALLALLFGVAGALGSMIHGTYDLANAIHPPAGPDLSTIPHATDPRGLLTFGATGTGVLILSWLIVRGGRLPRGLGTLGYLLAALLIILYLGRLIVLNPASPLIFVPALLTGFVVNPVWLIWLGIALRSGEASS